MARKQLRFGAGFTPALKNKHAQAATMVLAPGDCEGGLGNRHSGSDQWLYVPPAYTSRGDPLPRGR